MSAFHPLRTLSRLIHPFYIMLRGPTLKERLDRPTLVRLYEFTGLSSVEIAERYGVKPSTILKLMAEYGIPRRWRGAGKGV